MLDTQFDFFAVNKLVENFTLKGITFDANAENHPISNADGWYHKQAGLYLRGGHRNIRVENCTFQNWGGDQIIVMAEKKTYPSKNVWIQNNRFINVGEGANTMSRDHTCLFISSDNAFIRGNTFKNDDKTFKTTPFEAHGKNQWFIDNYVYNFARLGHVAANNYFALLDEQVENVYIQRNVSENVYYGVQFWQTNEKCTIENIDISENIFYLLDQTYGVAYEDHIIDVSRRITHDGISDVSIYNNRFEYLEGKPIARDRSTISISRGKNYKVKDNYIGSAFGYGIT